MLVTVISETAPAVTVAVAAAPVPAILVNTTVGAEVYPVPPLVTVTLTIPPVAISELVCR